MLPLDWQSWHAGQKGRADAHGSQAGNAQTISVECIMSGKGDAKDKRAEDNCARLVAWLLKTFSMNTTQLYTHNYWCNVRNGRTGSIDTLNKLDDGYKSCPVYIRPHWDDFVARVKYYMGGATTGKTSPKLYYVQVGAFSSKTNAEKYLEQVRADYPEAFIKEM